LAVITVKGGSRFFFKSYVIISKIIFVNSYWLLKIFF